MSGWNAVPVLHNPEEFTQMNVYLSIVIYGLKSFLRVGLVYRYKEVIITFRF